MAHQQNRQKTLWRFEKLEQRILLSADLPVETPHKELTVAPTEDLSIEETLLVSDQEVTNPRDIASYEPVVDKPLVETSSTSLADTPFVEPETVTGTAQNETETPEIDKYTAALARKDADTTGTVSNELALVDINLRPDTVVSAPDGMVIDDNEVLTGSGDINGDVFNDGIISPGNSPGIQEYDTLIQTDDGVLKIEIGGLNPGPGDPTDNGYDQVNVTGLATLDGTLEIAFLNNFTPTAGQVFDILNFGSVSGSFSDATGLYGFGDGSLYFEIVQHESGIQLVTREIPGVSGLCLNELVPEENDILGKFFNADYFGYGSYEINASLELSDFFEISGDFVLENTVQTVSLADGTSVNVDTLNIGGSNLNAFVGLNGGTADAAGINMFDVDFGLSLSSSTSDPDLKWTSLSAFAGSVAVTGLPDLTLSATDFMVEFNLVEGVDTGVDPNSKVINYVAAPLSIDIGAGGSISMDISGTRGEVFEASGNMSVTAGDFFNVQGNLAFGKSISQLTLSTGDKVDVDLLTLGAQGVDAFVGTNAGTDDAMGFAVVDVDYALVIAGDRQDSSRTWTTLSADAGSAAFAGLDDITVAGADLHIELNRAADDGTFIDYMAQEVSISVATGVDVTLDMDAGDGELTRISGTMSMAVGGFFQTSGSMAMEKQTVSGLKLSNGTDLDGDLLTLGSAELDAFVGLNNGSADELGFALNDVAFGLALIVATDDSTQKYTSLQTAGGSASFAGVDGLEITVSDLNVAVNLTNRNDDVTIDYKTVPLTITTGPGCELTLDMDGADGELLSAVADLDADLYGFLNVQDTFGIEKKVIADVDLSDGTTADMDVLIIGTSDVTAFAGLNGGTADAVGVGLGGVDVGLALMTDSSDSSHKFISIKANADSAALSGIDPNALSLEAEAMSVVINQAEGTSLLVDYSDTNLAIAGGTILDMDSARGELLEVAGNVQLSIGDFFSVSGGVALSASTSTLTLDDGTTESVDLLTIGAENLTAFAGLGGGTGDAVGIGLNSVDFALAIADEQDGNRSWTSLKATAEDAGFVGLDDITQSGVSCVVEVNLAASDNSLVDYADTNLTVATSSTTSMTLDMAGDSGELFTVAGNMNIGIGGFFQTSGEFAMVKQSVDGLKLSDNSDLAGDMLTLGATGAIAFAGLNGGTADAFGLGLSDVDFALAIINDSTATEDTYVALKANAGSVGFTGIDGLEMSASALDLTANLAADSGLVVDYATASLVVATSTSENMTLDMNGANGELLRAVGDLDINLFDFFSVEGTFGIEKKNEPNVALSNGSSVDMDILTIGASGVNAFAGINGGTADQVGMTLGNVDFGLALMTDLDDPSHKFSSLQATAATSTFAGIDSVTLASDSLAVAINQGVEIAAEQDITETGNSIYLLNLPAATVGTLTFTYNEQSATLDVAATDNGSSLTGAIKNTLESVSTIGVGNVSVTGDRYSGYEIELIGTLSGTDIAALSVTTAAASVTTTVEEIFAAENGVNEIKQIVIETPRVEPEPVFTSVTSDGPLTPGVSEIKSITFTKPYVATGIYLLAIDGIADSRTVTFRGSMTLTNETNIQSALVSLLGASNSDIRVKFDTKSVGGHRYFITFRNDLAAQDIGDLLVTNNLSAGNILVADVRAGADAAGTEQKILIGADNNSGSFTLTFDYDGSSYTTSLLDFSADAATVQTALTTAISAINGATASVTGVAGDWNVAFDGTLAGQTLNLLRVNAIADVPAPSGSFTITLDSETTAGVNYDETPATLAANIQSALVALGAIGNSDIVVSFDAGNSNADYQSYTVTFGGNLAATDIANFITDSTYLINALAQPYNVTQGEEAKAEQQKVTISTDAVEGSFTLSLTHSAQTYTTASIDLNASLTEVQTAVDTAFSSLVGADVDASFWNGTELIISFGGSLAGSNVADVVVAVNATTSAAEITQTQNGFTNVIAGAPAYTLVVDYDGADGGSSLSIAGGLALDMDGAEGETMKISGNMEIAVGDFFEVTGGFALEKYSSALTLDDAQCHSILFFLSLSFWNHYLNFLLDFFTLP